MRTPYTLLRTPAPCAALAAFLLLAGCDAFDAQRLGRQRASSDHGRGAVAAPDGGAGDVQLTPDAGPEPAAGGQGGLGGASGGGASGAGMRDGGGGPHAPDDAGTLPSGSSDAGDAGAGAGDAGAVDGGDAALPDGGDAGCVLAASEDPCTGIPALPAPPVIDGALDCGPVLAAITPTAWNGAAAMPAGHGTQLALAHRPDGLYVYVEVRGGRAPAPHPSTDPIYCGDAIELYVDADGALASDGSYDAPGTMQIIVAAPASEAAPNPHAERFRQGSTQGAWTSSAWQIAWMPDGYALEAFVVAADLGLPAWAPSGAVGIDLVIDVAGDASDPDLRCGLQLGQYFLRVYGGASSCSGEPWCDSRAFCAPALR